MEGLYKDGGQRDQRSEAAAITTDLKAADRGWDVRNGGGASDGVHVVVLGVVRGMMVVDVHGGDSEEEDEEEAGRGKLTPRTTQQCAKFKLRTVGFTAC